CPAAARCGRRWTASGGTTRTTRAPPSRTGWATRRRSEPSGRPTRAGSRRTAGDDYFVASARAGGDPHRRPTFPPVLLGGCPDPDAGRGGGGGGRRGRVSPARRADRGGRAGPAVRGRRQEGRRGRPVGQGRPVPGGEAPGEGLRLRHVP